MAVTHHFSASVLNDPVVDLSGASIAVGDLIFVALTMYNGTADQGVSTGPVGWTGPVDGGISSDFFGENERLDIYYRVATGAEGSSATFTIPAGWTDFRYILGVYRGNDAVTPIDAELGDNGGLEFPVINVTGANDLFVGFFTIKGGQGPYTPPVALTERVAAGGGSSSDPYLWLGDMQLTSSGNTPTGNDFSYPGSGSQVIWSFGVTPAGGASGITTWGFRM